ncbi:MAG: AAC(3) family N-acetyltransferase [Bryobacteraceae bacterium]|nr:AAC(3) family N-acetyltransferase [Bryobacteraceae bacterium]
MAPVTAGALQEQLLTLGVQPGDVLLVHTSFRAVRPVEGGPRALIDGLLGAVGPQGTLVMPAWSGDDDQPFDPLTSPVDESLGVTARMFAALPGVRRSDHVFAFAALGPRASDLLRDPLPLPPHRFESPTGRVAEAGGKVLLLGVGHDANTTLHTAEWLARVPYGVPRYCTVSEEGRLRRVDYLENDHCCLLFGRADDWLRARGLQREGRVGNAHARLARSTDVLDVALDHLSADPLVFLHPPAAGCEECDEARESLAPRLAHP